MKRKYTEEQYAEMAADVKAMPSIQAAANKWGCNKSTIERAIRRTNAKDMLNNYAPPGAQYVYQGGYYKVGLRGMVFMHNGSEWVRSTLSRSELRA
ncbi:MAG: hypothetical protein N0E44_18055 [Candidatus Thiodiazotropha lotti]|nr:hypothetical protein [Candidatus Thiodiazotropha lotti]MCW4221788.1 hypothetical protein [Candidatus Thiodiazotropha lotti]